MNKMAEITITLMLTVKRCSVQIDTISRSMSKSLCSEIIMILQRHRRTMRCRETRYRELLGFRS